MGMREVLTAPRAPWQNPFVERVIGSVRRECLDHFFVLNEAHLRRLLRRYLGYYNLSRPHQALGNNSPPHETSNPLHGAGLRSFLRSAGSITVTSASPDHELARRWPPSAYCRPTLARLRSLTTSVEPVLVNPRLVGPQATRQRRSTHLQETLPVDQCHDQVSDRDRSFEREATVLAASLAPGGGPGATPFQAAESASFLVCGGARS